MNAVVHRRAQPWLGTLISIEIIGDHEVDRSAACTAAFAAVARVHRAMSVQDTASDVARFNAADTGARVECDAWTLDVLERAERLRRASAGLFDVTLGSAAGPAYRCDVAGRGLEKLTGGARLDLGGIAKGYAVDRAVVALRAAGVRRGRVNAGGDLRVFGASSWPVVVRAGRDASALRIDLMRGAIATSEYRAGVSLFRHDVLVMPRHAGVHAIDATITVAAPTCVLADALTKIVALTGDARHPLVTQAGAQAWLQ